MFYLKSSKWNPYETGYKSENKVSVFAYFDESPLLCLCWISLNCNSVNSTSCHSKSNFQRINWNGANSLILNCVNKIHIPLKPGSSSSWLMANDVWWCKVFLIWTQRIRGGENMSLRKIHLQEAHQPQPAHGAPVFHQDPMRGKERKRISEKRRKKEKREEKHTQLRLRLLVCPSDSLGNFYKQFNPKALHYHLFPLGKEEI